MDDDDDALCVFIACTSFCHCNLMTIWQYTCWFRLQCSLSRECHSVL